MIEIDTTPAPERKRTRKIVAGTAVLVVGGGAAFAYWTAGGSGTGEATTGSSAPVIVVQTSPITGLSPNGAPKPLSGTFNNTNSAAVAVASVAGEVATTSNPDCLTSWYDIDGTATVAGGSVPVGNGVGSWDGMTIQLVNDPAVNQDACKGATVTIAYTATAPTAPVNG